MNWLRSLGKRWRRRKALRKLQHIKIYLWNRINWWDGGAETWEAITTITRLQWEVHDEPI